MVTKDKEANHSKNDDKKTTIFGAMKCSNCGKEIGKDENLTIQVKAKDLKVIPI